MKRGRLEKTSLSFRFYGHAFVFFFSSRRRHTRCSRDWSSDVCSSDLTAALAQHRLPDQSRRSLNGGMSAVFGRPPRVTCPRSPGPRGGKHPSGGGPQKGGETALQNVAAEQTSLNFPRFSTTRSP